MAQNQTGNWQNARNKAAKDALEQINVAQGKLPPQAIDVEGAVLGALMLEKHAYITVADIIDTKSFYLPEHRIIFDAIKSLSTNEKPVDLLMVTQELKNREQLDEVGGALYITQLTNRVASAAHIEHHARIIAQKYIQRELIQKSSDIQKQAYDMNIDVDDLINFAEKSIFEVAEGSIRKETQPIKQVLREATAMIEKASQRTDGLSGTPTGFKALDRLTSGWQKTDLVIIAARPAMGKTAFVLSMARNMAVDYKAGVAVFSLEMSAVQLVNRLIAAETELGSEKIKKGNLTGWEWENFHQKVNVLDGAPLFIDDTPALSIFEFRAKCRRLKMQHDIGVVIVDYLQLMTAGSDMRGNREQEVSMISRSLKAIAKELDIPIIALSQLSRAVESREGREPQLSDLRESGAIEQDADIVMFIHRPEYYGIVTDENGNSLAGRANIIVAKHRNGSTDTIHLAFKKAQVKFCDLEEQMPDEMIYRSSMNDNGYGASAPAMMPNVDFENQNGLNYGTIGHSPNDEVPF